MNRKTLKKVLHAVKPYRFLVGLSVLMAFLTVVSSLLIPILIGDAIDLIISAGKVDLSPLKSLLGRMAAVILLTGVCQWLMNILNNKIVYSVIGDFRKAAFSKLQTLPIAYLDKHPAGDILSRIVADVDQFADGLLMGFTELFTGVLTILGTLIFMVLENVQIALVVVILTPLSLFVARFIAGRTHKHFEAQSKSRGRETAFINEMIAHEKTVKAFGKEKDVLRSFDETDAELQTHALKATFFSSLVNPSTRFVNAVIYAVVGATGAFMVLSGNGFTVGQLTCFLTYSGQYAKPFNAISGVITELQNAFVCAERLLDLLAADAESPDPLAPYRMDAAKGAVEFRHVNFSYDPEKPLIRDFSMTAKPGERIAIVGKTGCGKTTLINLLLRFYDPESGEIFIDGVNTRDMTREDLRKQFGMVLQETWLKSGTIRENIVLGKPDATGKEILQAAKATRAYSFIRRLPEGFDTVIGEDGGGLSEGQKQLLSITRIMLDPPPMLILDEATSSIDTRTELQIQEAFRQLMKGRTSFIVAHRLSTIKNADRILVMDQGQILEQGRHEELLQKKGFYYDLYESQFKGVRG